MAREAWLAERRRGIGGSDAAAIAGLSKWRSPMAVWLEKTGQVEPEEPGEAALWGTKLEDVVARHFAEATGFKVQRCNAILQHPERPWMLANIDRYVLDPARGRGLLEVKTTNAWNHDASEDKAPDHYLIQVHHYLAVT
ncbi:MAG TPA: YqaJ viral recombinase family protein, partial [Firmicutes bacterium]|nr:YqaJ viral recombinase family protein [Bacillota bacterium]